MKSKILSIAFFTIAFLSFTNSALAADRYWVGGTATWDATAGSKWSTTSGGAGGEAVPTTSDNCYFDASSTGVVTVSVAACANLNLTGFTGTLAGSGATTVAGSLTLGAGMTNTYTGTITFTATSSQTITSNGISLDSPLTFNGAGGTWTLTDNLTTGATRTITLTTGTFDTGGFDVSTGLFSMNNSNTRVLNLNDSTFTLTGTGTVWHSGSTTGLTINAGTSTILITDTSTAAKTVTSGFNGLVSSPSLNTVEIHSGAGGVVSVGGTMNLLKVGHSGASAGIVLGSPVWSYIVDIDFTGFSGTLGNSVTVVAGDFDLTEATAISSLSIGSYINFGGDVILRSDIPSFSWTAQFGWGDYDSVADDYIFNTADLPLSSHGSGMYLAYNVGDTLTLVGDLVMPTKPITFYAGTLDANGYDVSVGKINTGGTASDYRLLSMGSGTWTLDSTGTVLNASTSTSFIIDGSTSTLVISDTSTTGKTISLNASSTGSFNEISIPATSNGIITLSNVNASTLTVDSTQSGSSVLMSASTTNEVANINVSSLDYEITFGDSSTTIVESITGSGLSLLSQTNTQTWFLNKLIEGEVTLPNVSVRDSVATPEDIFYGSGTSYVDLGNNTGWTFCGLNCFIGGSGSSAKSKSVTTESTTSSSCLPGQLFSATTGQPCINQVASPSNTNTPASFTPVPPTTSTTSLTQSLRIGMRNEDVRSLQKTLNAKGYTIAITGPGSPGNETSIFGTLTHMAVVKFQLANGLVGDGVVGPLTRAALER